MLPYVVLSAGIQPISSDLNPLPHYRLLTFIRKIDQQTSYCNPCLHLAPILCNGKTWVKNDLVSFLISLKPFSETDIVVCASGIPDHIKKMTGINPGP